MAKPTADEGLDGHTPNVHSAIVVCSAPVASRCSSTESAFGKRAVFGDGHEANREGEPGLGCLPASCFQPGGVIV